MRERLAEEWAVFLLAAQFLTRLPLPAEVGFTPARLAATPRWHPAVGALLGVLTGLVFWLAAQIWPPALAALISTAAGLLLTGAFHEDGFADACDGLGGGASRERALDIMRDSRIGTYGAAGLGLMLAAKVLALAALPISAVPLVLVAGHAAGRASSVAVIATSRYVRDHGTGKPVAAGIGPGGLTFALATGALAVLAIALVLPPAAVAGAVLGLLAGHLAMRARFEKRLGGYTGDCLGAVQQTSETGLYLGVLACLILLRHTRPAVADGLCYGCSDLYLDADFEPALAAILDGLPAVAAVLTSPLSRCRRLAERIAGARGLPLTEDRRLIEMNFGAWEGRPWAAIPRAELDAWAADFHHARPHGGDSVAMLAARVGAALAATRPTRPPTLWVAHAGVARAAAALTGRAEGWDTRLGFGRWLDLRHPCLQPGPGVDTAPRGSHSRRARPNAPPAAVAAPGGEAT